MRMKLDARQKFRKDKNKQRIFKTDYSLLLGPMEGSMVAVMVLVRETSTLAFRVCRLV